MERLSAIERPGQRALYKSTDGGKTWTQLTTAFPPHVGRIGIAVAPSNPKRVYANVDSDPKHGGVYRSDDAGATWTRTDGEARIWHARLVFRRHQRRPEEPRRRVRDGHVDVPLDDGGKSFDAIRGAPGGDDYHTLVDRSGRSRPHDPRQRSRRRS